MTNEFTFSYTLDIVGMIIPRDIFFMKYYQCAIVLCDNKGYGTK